MLKFAGRRRKELCGVFDEAERVWNSEKNQEMRQNMEVGMDGWLLLFVLAIKQVSGKNRIVK